MKNTTTPLPPSSTTSCPIYVDIVGIIDWCWTMIDKYEDQYHKTPSVNLDKQIDYLHNLVEYWEGVYLILLGKRYNEDFFEG